MSRLKRERKKAKLSQPQLARLSGVGQHTISRLENNKVLVGSFDSLTKLASALRICGRKVDAVDLMPNRQVLVKGNRTRKHRGAA
jgi:transcriptional regulator with XRE-family HTH domain